MTNTLSNSDAVSIGTLDVPVANTLSKSGAVSIGTLEMCL